MIPSPRALSFTLSGIVDPILTEKFFSQYWEKEPLVLNRGRPDYFGSLLSLSDIDHALTTLDLRHPEVSVVNRDREIRSDEYTRNGNLIDVPRLYQLFADGATIILTHLHTRIASLGELCRALECDFSAAFQTNTYLTPANARGFKPHYDTHDVFILQVAGSKLWRIYSTPVLLPLRGQDFDSAVHETGPPQLEVTLNQGDTLYIPRGFVHDAQSLSEPSLHITVGILAYTWVDVLLEALAGVALGDARFRRALPAGFAQPGFDRAGARQTFRNLLEQFVETGELDPAFDSYISEFVDTRLPLMRGQMAQVLAVSSMTGNTRVGPRGDLIYSLTQNDDFITVACFGNDITFPIIAAPAIRYALKTPYFTISELPGEIDEDGKLVLARRLVREGLLRLIPVSEAVS